MVGEGGAGVAVLSSTLCFPLWVCQRRGGGGFDLLMEALRSPSILRVSDISVPDFLLKLSTSSRNEMMVGSSSPPYLSLPRSFRKSYVLPKPLSTEVTADSAFAITLVMRSLLPASVDVKDSKPSSVSFTATSFS